MTEKFDLSVFNIEINNNICSEIGYNVNNQCKFGIKCIAIQRIICLLKYYSLLNIVNNAFDRDIFNNFINDIYGEAFINDYIRLINNHKHDLHEINKYLMDNKIFKQCDIKNCLFTQRHFVDNKQEIKNELNPFLNFYKQIIDSLHFYLYHLFECGLRSIPHSKINDDVDDIYFDKEFFRMNNCLNQRKYLIQTFNRFKNNDKFNINVYNKNKNDGDTTFMDQLYLHLNNYHKKETVNNFKQFMLNEQYDSDSLINDVDHCDDDGNILKYIKNDIDFINGIKEFIKNTQSMLKKIISVHFILFFLFI